MRNLDINVENLYFLPYPRFTPQEKSRTFIFRGKRYIKKRKKILIFPHFRVNIRLVFNNKTTTKTIYKRKPKVVQVIEPTLISL